MDISNWKYFYKIDHLDKTLCSTNMVYTPYVSPDDTIFCMSWDHGDPYQDGKNRPYYTAEMVDFFFNRELECLKLFEGKQWAPEVLEINTECKQIFYKWYGSTCNQLVFGNDANNIDEICPDWKTQCRDIVSQITQLGYYKMSLYPHCFYIDNTGTMRTMDFYASVPTSNPYVKMSFIQGMVGESSISRFADAAVNDEIDFSIFFSQTLSKYNTWPKNPFAT